VSRGSAAGAVASLEVALLELAALASKNKAAASPASAPVNTFGLAAAVSSRGCASDAGSAAAWREASTSASEAAGKINLEMPELEFCNSELAMAAEASQLAAAGEIDFKTSAHEFCDSEFALVPAVSPLSPVRPSDGSFSCSTEGGSCFVLL